MPLGDYVGVLENVGFPKLWARLRYPQKRDARLVISYSRPEVSEMLLYGNYRLSYKGSDRKSVTMFGV